MGQQKRGRQTPMMSHSTCMTNKHSVDPSLDYILISISRLTGSNSSCPPADEVSLRLLRGTCPQLTTSTVTLHTSPFSTSPGTSLKHTCQTHKHTIIQLYWRPHCAQLYGVVVILKFISTATDQCSRHGCGDFPVEPVVWTIHHSSLMLLGTI